MSKNNVVSLVGEFHVGGQKVQNLELDASKALIRFHEKDGVVAVLGQNTNGKLVKGFAQADDALLQQLDHLGSKRGIKDSNLIMPAMPEVR